MMGRLSFSSSTAASAGRGPGLPGIRHRVVSLPFVSLLVLLVAQLMVSPVTSEIIQLDLILDASSDEVHFVRGFLQAPASIDLSNVKLITNEEFLFDFGDDEYQYQIDDEFSLDDKGVSEDDDQNETFSPSVDKDLFTKSPDVDDPPPVVIPSGADDEGNNNNNDEGEGDGDKGDDEGDVDVDVDNNEGKNETKSGGETEKNTNDKMEGEPSAPAVPSGDESNKNDEGGDEAGDEGGDEGGDIEQNDQGEKAPETDPFIPSGDENNKNGDDEGNESGEEATSEEKNNNQGNKDQNEESAPVSAPVTTSGDENNKNGGDEGNESGGEATSEEKNNNQDNKQNDEKSAPVSAPVTPSGDEKNNDGGAEGNESGGEATNEEKNDNQGNKQNDEESAPVSAPVTTSGDEKNNNGGAEGNESGGDSTSEEKNNNQDNKQNNEDSAPVSAPVTPSGDKSNNNGGDEQKEEATKDDPVEDSPVMAPSPVSGDGTEDVDPVVDPNESEPVSAPTAENPSPAESGGGDRSLQTDNEAQASTVNQIMDIVLFLVPADCKSDLWGNCDWVTLGVGVYDDDMEGGMSYCCSKDAAARGVCSSDAVGTIMVDHSIFEGDHRAVEVPSQPLQNFDFEDPMFDIEKSGDYVMIIANCNDDGLGIITLGNMEWKSVGGYLPGDIFGLMFFYAALTAIYFVLGLWYYCGMKMFQESAIPIQKFILATIILGFLETSFGGMNLFIWNITGLRSAFVMYTALGLGILKQGSSRCLGVMVAMGWGVVRDTLGTALIKIVFLGLLYSGLTLARDFLAIAAESVQNVSITEEEELIDLALVLTPIIIFIDVIFYCWIISSLTSTTEYLRNMNQTSKLRRHLRLRCLIITSLVIIGILMVVNIVQVFTLILSQDQMWMMQAVAHANYLFILSGVAILWRPNSHAKDYAMQLELPAVGDGENELELSCVVPSADDMDFDGNFKIDDAVRT